MDKIERIFDLFFSLMNNLVLLGGGTVGAMFTWIFLSSLDMSSPMKIGITTLSFLVMIFVTSLLMKLLSIFN